MTELEFQSLANEGFNRIPLIAEALADLETPLSLYLKLAQSERNGANSFLLESVVGGERFGRYSFIGLPARTLLRTRNGVSEVVRDGKVVETHEGDPLEFIQQFGAASKWRSAPACRVSRAVWPVISATMRCATSRRSLRTRRPKTI